LKDLKVQGLKVLSMLSLGVLVCGLELNLFAGDREPIGPRDDPRCTPGYIRVKDEGLRKRNQEEAWHRVYALKEQKRSLEALKLQLPIFYQDAHLREQDLLLRHRELLDLHAMLRGQLTEIRELLKNFSEWSPLADAIDEGFVKLSMSSEDLLFELREFLISHAQALNDQRKLLEEQLTLADSERERLYIEVQLRMLDEVKTLHSQVLPAEPGEERRIFSKIFSSADAAELTNLVTPFALKLLRTVAESQNGAQDALVLQKSWEDLSQGMLALKMRFSARASLLNKEFESTKTRLEGLLSELNSATQKRDELSNRMGSIDSEIAGTQAAIDHWDRVWAHWDNNDAYSQVWRDCP